MDRKTQFELAKLAGIETETSNYYNDQKVDRSYYELPKDKDGWVDGNALLRSVKHTPITPQHRLQVSMKSRPEDNKLHG